MLEIYSTKNLLNEVEEVFIKEGIFPGKDKIFISNFLKNFFIDFIKRFIVRNFKDDGVEIKKLKDNVYELRKKINNNKLLRIIFYSEKEKIILATGYIIKDNKGNYKKQEETYINNLYEKEINVAYNIYKDFKNDIQKTKYINLNSYFK